MKLRIVALYKNSEGYYEDFTMVLSEITRDDNLMYKLRQIEGLHFQDYIVESCFIYSSIYNRASEVFIQVSHVCDSHNTLDHILCLVRNSPSSLER